MIRRTFRPFTFCVLMHVDKEYCAVEITSGNYSSLNLAKIDLLASFDFKEKDVPVLVDSKGNFYYYHVRYRRWYKNLPDETLPIYFPWLKDQEEVNDVPLGG